MPDIEITKLKIRRGTESQRLSVIFEQGELGYTIDTKRLYIGDGALYGGTNVSPRIHSINASYSSTVGVINDLLYKDGRLLQLSATDYSSADSWAYVGPKVDNITIALSSWGSVYNLALIQSGIIVLSALTNTGNGISVNTDNSTISVDLNNNLYVLKNGITDAQIANNAVVSYKISSDALATLGGINITSGKLTLSPTRGLTINSSNNLQVAYDNTLTVNNSNQLTVVPANNVLSLCVGPGLSGAHSFIKNDNRLNQVYSVGLQTNGNLGAGVLLSPLILPQVATFTTNHAKLVRLYSRLYNTFVIDLSGYVYATGLNENYQIGLQNTATKSTFTNLLLSGTNAPLSAVHTLAISNSVSTLSATVFAVTSASKVYGWGGNESGQLGVYNTTSVRQPILIHSLSSVNVNKVWVVGCSEGTTAYAKTSAGLVYSAGSNTAGQLANNLGTGATSTAFTLVSTISGVDNIFAVGEYRNNSVWFVKQGAVWGSGFNTLSSPLGCPSTSTITSVAALTALSGTDRYVTNIVGYTNGEDRTMFALTSSNQLFGWGANNNGQLGLGTYHGLKEPTFIADKIYGVDVGGAGTEVTTIVLSADGLYACGNNSFGVCGVGVTTSPINTFTKVLLPANVGRGDIAEFKINNLGNISTNSGIAYTLQVLLTSGKLLTCGYDSSRYSLLGTNITPQSLYIPTEIKL